MKRFILFVVAVILVIIALSSKKIKEAYSYYKYMQLEKAWTEIYEKLDTVFPLYNDGTFNGDAPIKLGEKTSWHDSPKLRFCRGERKYHELTEREYIMAESLLSGYIADNKGQKDFNGHVIKELELYFMQYCAYEERGKKGVLFCLYPYMEEKHISKPHELPYIRYIYNDHHIKTPKDYTDYVLIKVNLYNRTVNEVTKEEMR